MKTSLRIRLGLLLALAVVLAGCEGPCSKIAPITAPSLAANGVDLTTYVSVGTSLSSGYESGGLVDRHQVHSFPSLFARQIGKTVDVNGGAGTFTQPTINFDGIPALLQVKSIFCALLSRYRFELVDAPESYRDVMPSLILRTSDPCLLRYRRRA